MKRLWYAVLLLAIVAAAALLVLGNQPRAYPNTDAQTLRVANQLVESGQTQEAIAMYEQLLAQGVRSDLLYYNLGNAYYASGDRARALVAFLRARQLNPRDADID